MEIRRGFQCAYAAVLIAMVAKLIMIYTAVSIFPWYTFWKTVSVVLNNLEWSTIFSVMGLLGSIKIIEDTICE